jgi:hypothetical protein
MHPMDGLVQKNSAYFPIKIAGQVLLIYCTHKMIYLLNNRPYNSIPSPAAAAAALTQKYVVINVIFTSSQESNCCRTFVSGQVKVMTFVMSRKFGSTTFLKHLAFATLEDLPTSSPEVLLFLIQALADYCSV